jgi:cysteine desulfurase
MKLPIYLDHHATTPVDPRVMEVMLPYFTDLFGNAASIDHEHGYIAKQAVDNARIQVATAINADESEIVFTSGATESDNLAIIGCAEANINKGQHIITCVTEHKAVLDTCKYLETKGWKITYLPVDQYGLVSPDDLNRAITPSTVLISIMFANNEIGTLAPIDEIGKIAHEHGIIFHTDATQAAGYIAIDVEKMNIDLLSLSGHKIYGPKGIGALYIRKHSPRVKIIEQIHGGGHERGMRSGTLNVTGIVGFAKALEICAAELISDSVRLKELRDRLLNGLMNNIEEIEINGHPSQRLPNNLSLAIPGIESRSLILKLKHDISISIGSACTTSNVEPSHVIMALGFGEERAHSSIRIGLGRFNNIEEIDYTIQKLLIAIHDLGNITRYD